MKIVICKDKGEVSSKVANLIALQIKEKPNCVLGLATGRTMVPVYKKFVEICMKNKLNLSEIKTFNLDEYSSSNNEMRDFMNKNLFEPLKIKNEQINFLDGMNKDYEEACGNYEYKIKLCGGIDLQILGLGRNGHIGFNEPGSELQSRTRRVLLSESTKIANNISVEYALTMGVSTILSAKKIILMATGENKAEAISCVVKGEIGKKVPASFVRKHKNAMLFIDKAAAGKI